MDASQDNGYNHGNGSELPIKIIIASRSGLGRVKCGHSMGYMTIEMKGLRNTRSGDRKNTLALNKCRELLHSRGLDFRGRSKIIVK